MYHLKKWVVVLTSVCGYLSYISSSKDMYLIAYMSTSCSSITEAQYSNGVVAGVGI